jgi:alpha-1,6-mannosyltransferase
MHIADVTMFYAPESGGVRRYIEAKREWIARRLGLRHSLVVPRRAMQAASRGGSTIGVASVPLPFAPQYGVPLAVGAAARAIEQLRPDVIEAGDPYRLAWAAIEAGERLGAPVVGFCHSNLVATAQRWGGRQAARFAAAYMRRVYSRFDLVLAPSAAMTATLHGIGIPRARHQPLGVDLATFCPGRRSGAWRQRLGIARNERFLVYVGRFAPEKNLHVLAEAARLLGPRYALVLVGSGATPALPANARALRFVSDREALAALLADADVFVHAGDEETFGLAALEAMACGVPAVVPDAGGLAELVDAEVGAAVAPGDPVAFAEGIEQVFARGAPALGAAARRRASAYGWDGVLNRLLQRYLSLAKRRWERRAA